jgi:hypothetical protein
MRSGAIVALTHTWNADCFGNGAKEVRRFRAWRK